ncbi:Uncharacterized protein QTN25_003106 [Entamoeba marina]
MLLFLVLAVVSAQYVCSDAEYFNLPNFDENIEFGTSTPSSTIVLKVGQPEFATGFYLRTTPSEDILVNFNTCGAKTTLVSEIYIFEDCASDIASSFYMKSGVDNTCSHSIEYPWLDAQLYANHTYFIFIKLVNEDIGGSVYLYIAESFQDNSNYECNVAKEISSFPYVTEGTIINSEVQPIKPECYLQSYSTLWYSFTGTGENYLADTCNYYTNFDTRITIVTDLVEGKCNSAPCLKQADDGCGADSTSTIVAFYAETGVTYYIGVSGALGKEGQFQLQVDKLSDEVPSICSQAVPIKSLPFSGGYEIPDTWPSSDLVCTVTSYQSAHKTVYFSFAGNNRTMVISTCKSLDSDLNPIGVGLELFDNCVDETCLMTNDNFGECGENEFIVYNFELGHNYIIAAYCKDGSCEIDFDMYEKTEDHSTCERALELNEPGYFGELVRVETMSTSVHGCDSIAEQHPGLWYKLYKTEGLENERYSILALNQDKSKSGFIEFSFGCNIIQCDAVIQGEATLTFSENEDYQYIFIYSANYETALIIEFLREEENTHHTCETALSVTLPYTAVHSFDNSYSHQLCSGDVRSANYYSFTLDKDIGVDVSTCFTKTTVNTATEFIHGCYGDSSLSAECIGSNLDGKGCENGASKMSIDLYKNIKYTLSVYSENVAAVINIKQYRVVLFTLEIPENSACSEATTLNHNDYYAEYLILNRLDYTTNLGEFGTTRGNYFRIQPDVDVEVTVRTCSSNTTMKSMILLHDKCSTQTVGDEIVSYPDEMTEIASSSLVNCDVHGTYLTFTAKAEKEQFIFIGPEYFEEEGFIGIEFYMDAIGGDSSESEGNESSESTSNGSHNIIDDDNGLSGGQIFWIIFGVGLYIIFACVLAAVIVFVALKARTSGYATLD